MIDTTRIDEYTHGETFSVEFAKMLMKNVQHIIYDIMIRLLCTILMSLRNVSWIIEACDLVMQNITIWWLSMLFKV